MATIKKLAGQTVIYGMPTILGRLLNYLLVPLQTYVFATDQYGIIGELYAWMSLLLVILTYGFETAFFRFSQEEGLKDRTYSTSLISLLTTSTLFMGVALLFSNQIASVMNYAEHPEYIRWVIIIVSIDAFISISFAKLRLQMRAVKFAVVKFANIGTNILLNLLFLALLPYLYAKEIAPEIVNVIYDPSMGVGYVFIANVVASLVTLLLLIPEIFKVKWCFDFELWKKMMRYALPLLVLGLAGIVNETMDRVLIKYLSPKDIAQSQVGIYSACYKISIMMTIFIQAFKYAAEPFFFSKAKDRDAKETYANVMTVFVLICTIMFVGIMLYIDIIKYFVGPEYHVGLKVVPVLLMANLFLGIFYNLSIWYKLTDQTRFGAYITLIGAAITLLFNFLLIPIMGYYGSAWTTFLCYFTMVLLSYFIGQKYYPINYQVKKIVYYILFAVIIYLISDILPIQSTKISLLANTGLLLVYLFVLYLTENKTMKKIILS
ncbi:MAG TPA: oligosaccharide flippase family protein [Bacteroidales bacterium]|nr:oligosaccharide flippase family protein [Bacteroidales bacterium]HOS57917.1 oligosaccharide flippase family protein [Bacteroidales bacterium]HPY81049.1 oligosaccharide flippase family protein [Bacteroidales bacterium]HQA86926.1 oligosaccharide flippase family protein [Bacteroidales bacterium]HRT13800.1 oligosaccharide flippase family protein [Bacteroidales bacterium]